MGKRYSREELEQIKALAREGLSSKEIATSLGRTEAGIRNIRHRVKIRADTQDSIHSLSSERNSLRLSVMGLRREVSVLQARRNAISKLLQTEVETLKTRLQRTLLNLKDQKPELFQITGEEQILKLTGQLLGSFLRWLIK